MNANASHNVTSELSREFIAFACEQGVLRFGEFKTKAGRLSPYFFNAGLFNDGASLSRLGDFYARRILAAGVHGVLSGPALQRIEQSPLEQVLITNTTPVEEKLQKSSKLRSLSVAPLLGEAIRRIHENSSVSSLFV